MFIIISMGFLFFVSAHSLGAGPLNLLAHGPRNKRLTFWGHD